MELKGLQKDQPDNDVDVSDSLFEGAEEEKFMDAKTKNLLIVPIVNLSFFECDFDLKVTFHQIHEAL